MQKRESGADFLTLSPPHSSSLSGALCEHIIEHFAIWLELSNPRTNLHHVTRKSLRTPDSLCTWAHVRRSGCRTREWGLGMRLFTVVTCTSCSPPSIFLNRITVYSFYGICEYLVVLTNIAFHSVQGYDFGSQYHISIAPPSRLKHNWQQAV